MPGVNEPPGIVERYAGMRRLRKILSLLPLIFIFVFVSSPPTVSAQTTPTIIYQTDFNLSNGGSDDFYGDDTFWNGEEWLSSCGVDGLGCIYTFNNNFDAGPRQAAAIIDYNQSVTNLDAVAIPWSACVINYVEFDVFFTTNGNGGTDDSAFFFASDDDGSAAIVTPATPADFSFTQSFTFSELGAVEGAYTRVAVALDNTAPMDAWSLRFAASLTGMPDPATYVINLSIDNLTVWCDYPTGDWIRPLSDEDEHPQWEMFDRPYAASLGATFGSTNLWVNSFSANFHVPVHSAVAGTVTYLAPLVATDPICGYGVIFGICVVYLPDEITQDGNQGYKLDLVLAYKVVVSFGDFELTYLVYNAPAYVTLGQEIGEGCVIGETIQLLNQTNYELTSIAASIQGGASIDGDVSLSGSLGATVTFRTYITANGFVGQFLKAGGIPQRLYPRLTRYPSSDSPCTNTNPRFANCLGTDPELRVANADGRSTVGNVTFDNPGFTLISSGALVRQVMALEPTTEYSLSVDVEAVDPGGQIELKLGTTVERHYLTAPVGERFTLTIAAAVHLADLTDYWTVQVKNISSASIKVLSICVTSGDVAGQPTSCYFSNPLFDQGDANWDVSEGVGQRDGSITVPSLDTFAQEATLPADEPDTTFQLYVDVYIWTEPGVEISRTDYTSTVQMEYQFPDSGADWVTLQGPSSTDTTTFSEFALAAERQGVTVGTVSFQAFITIDVDTTGTITIRPTVTTAVPGVLGVGIDRACLRGDFGVDQGDDIIGIDCQAVTRPQDQLLSSWTVWLWRQFNRFFQCDLMIVLRQIRNTTYEIYRLSGWQIRYWKASYFYNVQWLSSDLFPWLNGHFRNIAIGNVTTIQATNTECGSNWIDSIINFFTGGCGTGLFDFLTSLVNGILNTINLLIGAVYNLLSLLISGIFGVIFTLLALLFGLIRDVINLFLTILNSWNSATPTAIPGLPSCETDPSGNYLCLPFYILNNTIFTPGEEGSILIVLMISYGSFELILWVISKLRQKFSEVTAAV